MAHVPTSELIALLGDALDQLDFGVLLLDRNMRTRFVNRSFAEFWQAPEHLVAAGPGFHDLLMLAVERGRYGFSGEAARAYVEQHEAAVRAGDDTPMEIVLNDGRLLLCRCVVARHGGRILTYTDATRVKQDAERLSEAERMGAELRFSMETMEDQASYLASLAEESDANRQRAEAARQQLEHEITERQLLEAELRLLATTDALTGTLNRRHFFALGQRALTEARELDQGVAVLMVDIDHFKSINDRHGHAVGDEALKHVVNCLQIGVRRVDLLGRIGGEEFAVVLPDIGVAAAAAVADRLRSGVASKPLVHGGGEFTMTVSVGLAMACGGDRTIDQVIARADAQLYRAKSSGRNCVCFEKTPAAA